MTDAASHFAVRALPPKGLRRRLAIGLSLALIFGAGGAALYLVDGVERQLRDVSETNNVRRVGRELIQVLTDAENARRGFLLTQDGAFLEAYQSADQQVAQTYARLLAATDPAHRGQVAEFERLIEAKRKEIAQALAGTENPGEPQMQDPSRSTTLFEEVRSALDRFLAQQDELLVARNDAVEHWRRWLVAAILVALAGAAGLAFAFFSRTQRQFTRLWADQDALELLNQELERSVAARTAELQRQRVHADKERERVESLLRESNHRIGNSLATVSSLLGLQILGAQDEAVRSALDAARERIHTIASGHRRLRLGPDFETVRVDEFLSDLLGDLQTARVLDGIELVTRFEPLTIGARDATTIGILLGELLTNARKHAFPDASDGRVEVTLSRDEEGHARLEVADDGIGLPPSPTGRTKGLGGTIVAQLARQFGCEPVYGARPGGGTLVSLTLKGLLR